MKKQISILGCGWFGLPLAKHLITKGFVINGSTTTSDKIFTLENANIKPFIISLSENKIIGAINDFLLNSEILIIDVPPKLRSEKTDNFVQKITNLIPFIEKSTVKNVIFVSSTSVYKDEIFSETEPHIVTEKTICFPETESGKQLLETEKLLMSNKKFKTITIRFGGLIGDDRNPTKFLAGRKQVANPNAPINFIHQMDCIGIIEKIIETNSWNQIFNGVAPNHPTRIDYYLQKAQDFGLEPPEFESNKTSFGKIVSSQKVQNMLGFEFVGEI
ncbi:MAG: SDR family NAD(P)-dependent oxidoreductase [Flavobacterium sp.]|nr:SDR family NAD(P)-dependent oxidoreductase [Flavobacterium sp.]